MELINILEATEAIKVLKAKYFRFVDSHEWEPLRQLFAPDASLFFPESLPAPASVDEFMEGVATMLKGSVSIHRGFMPEIEILSETLAKAIWPMEDQIYFAPGGQNSEMRGAGHYYETYECVDDSWYIKSLKLTRVRLQYFPAENSVI